MFSDCGQEGMTEKKRTVQYSLAKNKHIKIFFESEPATDMFFDSDGTNVAMVQLVFFDSFGQWKRCC